MKKVGILSDTHGYTHPKLFEFFKSCDEIWHLGDMMNIDIIYELETVTKVRAVYGNCDGWDVRSRHKEWELFDFEEHKVLLKHIVGKPGRYYPDALALIQEHKPTIVVAGHSHILMVKHDPQHQCLYINPGSAGKYGIHTRLTFLRLDFDGKKLANLEIFDEAK